jgi:2-polyprenyl-3-methyl-5-hydroxy-6-metoxy-1,4-benzoquinol methylase
MPFSYEEILLNGVNEVLGVNKCVTCQCIYTSPRLNGAGLRLLYGSLYETHTVSGRYNIASDISAREYKSFYQYVMRLIPDGGRVLDVGCGVGNYLDLFKAKPEFDVEGVEYSSYAAQKAIDKGLKVYRGDLRELSLQAEEYDVVAALYVLEHVREPVEVLGEMLRLLKPGGYIILAVPNYNYLKLMRTGLVSRILFKKTTNLYPAEHLQNFTPRTIEYAIRKAGLTPVKWNLAMPLSFGSKTFRMSKILLYPIFKLLFICGLHLGGIHLIARKDRKSEVES